MTPTLHPDLAAIAAAHVPSARQVYCRHCRDKWPCSVSVLWTAYHDAMVALAEATWKLSCGEAARVMRSAREIER